MFNKLQNAFGLNEPYVLDLHEGECNIISIHSYVRKGQSFVSSLSLW